MTACCINFGDPHCCGCVAHPNMGPCEHRAPSATPDTEETQR